MYIAIYIYMYVLPVISIVHVEVSPMDGILSNIPVIGWIPFRSSGIFLEGVTYHTH